MRYQYNTFSDQSIDNSCKKSNHSDQEYAVVKSTARKYDEF